MAEIFNGKFYATSRAYIVEEPSDLPREMASEFTLDRSNASFIWIAGRYVQANNTNRNGHYWSFDDLKAAEASIRHTPVNALHEFEKPIGTVVQTKIVQREAAAAAVSEPEIQALSVVWAANFPTLAHEIRDAHKAGTLYYSMECVSENIQCLQCEQVFAYASTAAERCEHLGTSPIAPRRFLNTTFLGAALVFPPDRPAWADAEITDMASLLTKEYANRNSEAARWESLMAQVVELSG